MRCYANATPFCLSGFRYANTRDRLPPISVFYFLSHCVQPLPTRNGRQQQRRRKQQQHKQQHQH